MELAVRRTLRKITHGQPAHDALAASALALAQALDSDAGLATAAVARELRATLDVLTRGSGDDGAADATARLLADLSTAVGHSPN